MARLLRVHFASIGHRDARLAPLTLDFRSGNVETRGTGSGVDSLLLLRNGGGKSSIINLFYSVFRTQHREFLGSAAEGKARRIDDYVKASDLAFVITEWDVAPESQPALFDEAPTHLRVVGQVLAWKGQQRSADRSRLRRLFFSFKASRGDGGLCLDAMPVQGLAEPAPSFDHFREWLKDASQQHSDAEVIYSDHHRRWEQHLESIGLDPQVFRYQLKMNRREGAADEAFRFGGGREFVGFLLDLALETVTADQLAKNLEAQRESLSRRPAFELERRFLATSRDALRTLEEAVSAEDQARALLDDRVGEAASLVAALEQAGATAEARAGTAREEAERAAQRLRHATNDRDKLRRWRGGLLRLACEHDARARVAALEEAEALRNEGQLELAEGRAALTYRGWQSARGRVNELEAAVERAREEAAPLIAKAEGFGADLVVLLRVRERELDTERREIAGLQRGSEEAARQARDRADAARDAEACAKEELRHLDAQLARRDRARQRLLDEGLLEVRESADAGRERWGAEAEQADGERKRCRTELQDREEATREAQRQRLQLAGERASVEERIETLRAEVERGRDWSARLADDPLIAEVEGIEKEAQLSAPGLEERLRQHAQGARREQLQIRVAACEDERAHEAIERDGLLPGPAEQEALLGALRGAGVNAHGGLAYVAENVDRTRREAVIAADPHAFGGVVVVHDEDLRRAASLRLERAPRMPLTITRIERLDDVGAAVGETPRPSQHVILPAAATYDQHAAQRERDRLQLEEVRRRSHEQTLARREEALRHLAEELSRYLKEYGEGGLDRLAERLDEETAQRDVMARRDSELAHEATALASQITSLRARADTLETRQQQAERTLGRIEHFIEEHEAGLEAARKRRQQTQLEQKEALRRCTAAREQETREASQAASFALRVHDLEHAGRTLLDESEAVAYKAAQVPDVASLRPGLTLEVAREAYGTARRQVERELGEQRLLGELSAARERATEAGRAYRRALGENDDARVRTRAERQGLEGQVARLELALPELIEQVGEARQALKQTRDALAEHERRREADDLPTERARPPTAEAARALAVEMEARAEEASRQALEAGERHKELRAKAESLAREAAGMTGQAEGLREVVQVATGAPLPPRDPAALGEEAPEVRVRRVKKEVREAKQAHDSRAARSRQRAEAVQRVANDPAFGDLKGQHRERLRGDSSELRLAAQALRQAFDERFATVEDLLAQFDKDRRVLVGELLQLTDQVELLLKRATRASTLPAELRGWGGRSYLRIRFAFPAGDEERRARLEPLVDRLVQQATIPGGLELVKQSADALAGQSGFEVGILKPDSVLRPEPVPISAMSTFSRGQQLTAAIVLYCTLVQLRARSRGRGAGAQDAGVLILDNPIGTCSSVPLLRLQRRIAEQMRVQLIYATGVEDLEAAAVLPNTIRLRNDHRERRTGDHHVSAQTESVLEGVRVLEVSA